MRANREKKISCFKAYDVRGKVPDELNEDLAFRIGRAYAALLSPSSVAVGHDVRLSSPSLASALSEGLLSAGVDVIDLGLCGTEEVYFASFSLDVDGGIMVTASHNPSDYNGMKFVGKGAVPLSRDSGLKRLEGFVSGMETRPAVKKGRISSLDNRPAYIEHLLGYVDLEALSPLKLVVNAGNGCAGPVIDLLEDKLPFTFVKIDHEPDGTFPHGVPNPLLPEKRAATAEAVRKEGAAMGIAWDGDFDRCFLFDEKGNFVEGYYIVGLLAQAMLRKSPGSKIIHDPRLIWNTRKMVEQAGGVPVMCKAGHAFIKERMRKEDAVYGGEMSAHHFFRDFAYCDSGMIPWLLVAEILCTTGKRLSELVEDQVAAFPVSGEINVEVTDPDKVLAGIESMYGQEGEKDYTDGLSITYPDYRFNLRKSNTEPVLRLNLESRGNRDLVDEKTRALLESIRMLSGPQPV